MKSSITAIIFACLVLCPSCMLRTAAFSTQPLPGSHPSPQTTTFRSRPSGTALCGVRSAVRNAFRRGVRTLEPDTATPDSTKEQEPKQLWRLVYHDCEYTPESIARVVAKLIPSLNRRTAYELCSHARMVGRVPLLVTTQKDAERYRDSLLRYGLTATVEPHTEID